MERPADDIFLVNDLSALKSPIPRHLFLGRSSDASSSANINSTVSSNGNGSGANYSNAGSSSSSSNSNSNNNNIAANSHGSIGFKPISPGLLPTSALNLGPSSPPIRPPLPENRPAGVNQNTTGAAKPPVPLLVTSPTGRMAGLPRPEPKPAVPTPLSSLSARPSSSSSSSSSSSLSTGKTLGDRSLSPQSLESYKKESADRTERITEGSKNVDNNNIANPTTTIPPKRKRGRPPGSKSAARQASATGDRANKEQQPKPAGESMFTLAMTGGTGKALSDTTNPPNQNTWATGNASSSANASANTGDSGHNGPTKGLENGERQLAASSGPSDGKPKTIELTDWSLATVPNSPKLTSVSLDEQQFWVVLVGRRPDMAEAWHSSIVTERLAVDSVKTGSGRSIYYLRGPINRKDMIDSGFSESFIDAFAVGFPESWRSLLLQELSRMTRALATGQVVRRGTTVVAAASTGTTAASVPSLEKSQSNEIVRRTGAGQSISAPQPAPPVKRKRGRPPKYPRATQESTVPGPSPGPSPGPVPVSVPVPVPQQPSSNLPLAGVSLATAKSDGSPAGEVKVPKKRGRKPKPKPGVPIETQHHDKQRERRTQEDRKGDNDAQVEKSASKDPTGNLRNTKGSSDPGNDLPRKRGRPRKERTEEKTEGEEMIATETIYTPPSRPFASRRRSTPGSGLVKWGWGGKAIITATSATPPDPDTAGSKRNW